MAFLLQLLGVGRWGKGGSEKLAMSDKPNQGSRSKRKSARALPHLFQLNKRLLVQPLGIRLQMDRTQEKKRDGM